MIPVPRKLWAQISAGSPAFRGAALDHLERPHPRHGPLLEHVAPPRLAAPEKGPALVLADAGGLEVDVDVFLGSVVGGDHVIAAAFLVEPEERARSWV